MSVNGEGGESSKAEDLYRVLEITRSMAAAQDLQSLLELIIERSRELLDAERATLFLYDAESNELVSRVATGVNELRVPADRGISGATIKTGKTLNVADAYTDERFNPEVDRTTGFLTRNLLSVPLRGHQGALVGVLQVINKRKKSFTDYDVTLAETLAAQAGVAIQRADLIEHYIQKQEMERAMRIARDIQRGLLPKAPPQAEGFEVAGLSWPADETGGDVYDFLELPDGRWMIVVADASGHGIGSALVIAETRAMRRAVSLQGSDGSKVLRTVNDLLFVDLCEERFVTCFFGVLDPADASLYYASAGHGPLLFYDRAEDSFAELPATALPLAVLCETDYGTAVSHVFAPGDFAVITTDGFTEAVDPHGEQFGTKGVMDAIRRDRDLPAAEMIANLKAEVDKFTRNAPQLDDLTAVIIKKT